MAQPDDDLEPDDPGLRIVEVTAEEAGGRLDKTLTAKLPELSRGRVQALLAAGAISLDERALSDASGKTAAGLYRILIPATVAAEPQAEAIPLSILFEDQHLVVLDKASGMAVHPAPGNESGTLVNALLHHCGDSLSGIGGVARPGIVHRLDMDTSGVMVAAKTDAAHRGLSALFEAHDIERLYIALARGVPRPREGTIETRLGRSPHDRKKIAVMRTGGRAAVTHYVTQRIFGPSDKPMASRIACRLETGRTHQIRVHLASKGAPCLGDALYGSGPPAGDVRAAMQEAGLERQALHAAVLGFVHPVTGETLRFETPLPPDMAQLEQLLGEL